MEFTPIAITPPTIVAAKPVKPIYDATADPIQLAAMATAGGISNS